MAWEVDSLGKGPGGGRSPRLPHGSLSCSVRAGPRGPSPEGHSGQGLALAGGRVGRVVGVQDGSFAPAWSQGPQAFPSVAWPSSREPTSKS